MESLVFVILAALSVGLLAWALVRAVFSGERANRHKLQQRLSGERREGSGDASERSILLLQTESTGLSAALAQRSFFGALARRLAAAQPGMTLVKFLLITSAAGMALFMVLLLLTDTTLIAVGGGAVAAYIPYHMILGKYAKRQRALAEQLPEALDFLSRILRAGHSLSTGLQMMGTELPDPLASEFRRCYDQHSLGSALEDCLKDMASRIGSTDFSFFVTAVLIQRQTGGDLSMVLNNISGMVRGRIRLQSYVRAKTAEGRFTGYILVAFPVLMFFIAYYMNPEYSGVLLHTSLGLKLMATAGGLELIGLFAIKKLTTVKV